MVVTVTELMDRVYLGDGLFASFDGYQYVLAASDGIRDTNTVFLEPSTMSAFENYIRDHRKKMEDFRNEANKES